LKKLGGRFGEMDHGVAYDVLTNVPGLRWAARGKRHPSARGVTPKEPVYEGTRKPGVTVRKGGEWLLRREADSNKRSHRVSIARGGHRTCE